MDLLDPAARQSVRALVLHGFLHATTAALETAVPGTMGTCTGKLYIWWKKKRCFPVNIPQTNPFRSYGKF